MSEEYKKLKKNIEGDNNWRAGYIAGQLDLADEIVKDLKSLDPWTSEWGWIVGWGGIKTILRNYEAKAK